MRREGETDVAVIRADFDPVAIALTYQRHGASCLSMLTDEHYFQGSLEYLRQVRAAVTIPVLRKSIPADRLVVGESGIRTAADVQRLAAAGVNAMLVGESLMAQTDIAAAVDALLGKR